MKKIFAIKYTILFLSLLLIICCSSTKPNTPYSGSYPSEYHELAERNPLLAKELAKLPEINNGISNTEKQAIINIAVLYNKDPFAFDKAFGQMYQIGIPDLRKYCSPLQAFYWLFEDDKTIYINDMIKEYSLKRLLNYSWDFDRLNFGVFLDFQDQMIPVLLNDIKDKEGVYIPEGSGITNDKLKQFILNQYINNPDVFSNANRSYIEMALEKNKNNDRWSDFNQVVDRLNAPELIDYYEKGNFVSKHYRRSIEQTSPKYIFKNKIGNCAAFATFTRHCLSKAGYPASIEAVPGRFSSRHKTTIYKVNKKWFILDNYKWPMGGIRGPFGSKREALKIYY